MSNQFLLDHLATFSLEGQDARAYAQSQFTVSIDSLSGAAWSPLAWCDPKGRVVAFMMARAGEERVDLVAPTAQADPVRERLRRFTIGRRVALTDIEPVSGTFEPDEQAPALSFDAGRGLRAGSSAPADPDSLTRWRRLDLCRGLPWLGPDSSGQHLPQWLGLEELGALAYDKGCYPGQEVIARLHYRGSVKYRLTGVKVDAQGAIESHARITDSQGRGVGHWLWGMSAAEGTVGLAVLATRVAEGDDVLLPHDEQAYSARVTSPETLC